MNAPTTTGGKVELPIERYEELRALERDREAYEANRGKIMFGPLSGFQWPVSLNRVYYRGRDEAIKELVEKLNEAKNRKEETPSYSSGFLDRVHFLFTGELR